jgi:hypothetical protein
MVVVLSQRFIYNIGLDTLMWTLRRVYRSDGGKGNGGSRRE